MRAREWLQLRWKGLLIFFSVVGPGIITANVDNDAGGITTYSLAGAHYGQALLWSLIPISLASSSSRRSPPVSAWSRARGSPT